MIYFLIETNTQKLQTIKFLSDDTVKMFGCFPSLSLYLDLNSEICVLFKKVKKKQNTTNDKALKLLTSFTTDFNEELKHFY